jgi:Holliday junction resolvase
MPLNSRSKGAVGERELADELVRLGMMARRTVQYSGKSGDAADLVVDGLALHVECKRTEQIRMDQWLEQVKRDCNGRPWIICMRQSRRPWLVVQTLDQWAGDSSSAAFARMRREQLIAGAMDATEAL